jgi:hypothetical protein
MYMRQEGEHATLYARERKQKQGNTRNERRNCPSRAEGGGLSVTTSRLGETSSTAVATKTSTRKVIFQAGNKK